jgi:acyl-CoA thioesterase FadM
MKRCLSLKVRPYHVHSNFVIFPSRLLMLVQYARHWYRSTSAILTYNSSLIVDSEIEVSPLLDFSKQVIEKGLVTVLRSQDLEIFEDIAEYDPIKIYSFFNRLGRSSFGMTSEAYKGEVLVARGTAALVTVDLTNPLQVVQLPDQFRKEVEGLLIESPPSTPMPAQFTPLCNLTLF